MRHMWAIFAVHTYACLHPHLQMLSCFTAACAITCCQLMSDFSEGGAVDPQRGCADASVIIGTRLTADNLNSELARPTDTSFQPGPFLVVPQHPPNPATVKLTSDMCRPPDRLRPVEEVLTPSQHLVLGSCAALLLLLHRSQAAAPRAGCVPVPKMHCWYTSALRGKDQGRPSPGAGWVCQTLRCQTCARMYSKMVCRGVQAASQHPAPVRRSHSGSCIIPKPGQDAHARPSSGRPTHSLAR